MDVFQKARVVMAGGMAVVIILAVVFFTRSQNRRREAWAQASAAEAGGEGAASTPEVDAIRRRMYTEPGLALAEADRLAAAPGAAAGHAAVLVLRPELVSLTYHRAARAGDEPAARAALDRLAREWPDSGFTAGARADWGRFLEKKLRAAIAAGETSAVERVFAEYRAGAFFAHRRDASGERRPGLSDALDAYADFRCERWLALPAPERRRGAGLELAADAFGVAADFAAVHRQAEALRGRAGAPSATELSMVQAALEAAGHREAAFRLQGARLLLAADAAPDYAAAQAARAAAEARFVELGVGVARRLQADPGAIATTSTPDALLSAMFGLVQSSEPRLKLAELRLALASEDFMAATEPLAGRDPADLAADTLAYEAKQKLAEALHAARNASTRVGVELPGACAALFAHAGAESLWPRLPEPVRRAVDAAVPAGTPVERLGETRRREYERLLRAGTLPAPVVLPDAVETRRLVVAMLNGVYRLEFERPEAFRELRRVLRSPLAPAQARDRIRDAVRTAIRRAVRTGGFDALIDLAGFYGAEFGERLADDTFRGEFRAALESLAAKHKDGDPMRHAFALAMIASAFPGEPFARAADAEAVRTAMAITARQQPETKPAAILPSGLPGHAVLAVTNATEHHILFAFDGPDRCVVLCPPMRKGAFPLRVGAYKMAVLTPLGSIRPLREDCTFGEVFRPADYRVVTVSSRTGERHTDGVTAIGDFSLLRSGEGLPRVTVDPATGYLRPR